MYSERSLELSSYWCGVPLQVAVNLAQVEEVRLLHKTGLSPGGIQDWCRMTLEKRQAGTL